MKKEKKLEPHIFYLRGTKKMLKQVQAVAKLNHVSVNAVLKTIIENYFGNPKPYFQMKQENL